MTAGRIVWLMVLFSLAGAAPATAQDGVAGSDGSESSKPLLVSPSEAVRAVEEEGTGGGAASEVDAAAAQAAVPANEAVAGVSPASRRQIEEIVVQARRRNELLEDTPVSVTALGETAIRESTITRLNQITELVPNLQFDSAAGTSTTARVFVRGVGINDTIMTNRPTMLSR